MVHNIRDSIIRDNCRDSGKVLIALRSRFVRNALDNYIRAHAPEVSISQWDDEHDGVFFPSNPAHVLLTVSQRNPRMLICDWSGSNKDLGMTSHLFMQFPQLKILCLMPNNRMRILRRNWTGDSRYETSLPGILRIVCDDWNHRELPYGFGPI